MVMKKGLTVVFLAVLMISVVSALTINYPENTNYGVDITDLIYNVEADPIDTCIYSLDGGETNLSDFNAVPSVEGSNTLDLYCKNSTTIERFSAQVTYWQDSVFPVIDVTIPATHSTTYTSGDTFDVSGLLTETNLKKYNDKDMKIWVLEPGWTDPAVDYINGGDVFTYPNLAGTLDKEGAYTYTIFARDQYPDGTTIREISEQGIVIRDITPPTTSITGPEMEWHSDDFLNSRFDDDALSGVDFCEIMIQQPGDGWETTLPWTEVNCNDVYPIDISNYCTVEGADTCKIDIRVTDNVGLEAEDSDTWSIDTTPPVITLIGANPQTIEVFDAYVELGATADDILSGDLTADIVIDISDVDTDVLGPYVVTYFVMDLAGNMVLEPRTVNVVDTVAPIITLVGDDPVTVELGGVYPEFGATALDEYDGDISTDIVIDDEEVDTGSEGVYTVYYDVNDGSGNPAERVERTVIVEDNVGPTVSTIEEAAPEDGRAYDYGTDFDFIVNADDLSGINDCTLDLNGIEYDMSMWGEENPWGVTVPEGEVPVPLDPGLYEWFVTCEDDTENENEGVSETLTFTILADYSDLGYFDDWTDLEGEDDISNVMWFFVRNQYGMIEWTEMIDFSSGFDWTELVNISENHIEVDSTTPELNKSAIITIFNISFTNPAFIEIYKDGALCTDCPINYYTDDKNLSFNVTAFTTYSGNQGAYCGDGIVNNGETCSDCPDDAGVCPAPSSGGGGGGSRSPDPQDNTCTPERTWDCSEWSECVDGMQTRTCTKLLEYCLDPEPSQTQFCTQGEGATGEGEETGADFLSTITGATIGTPTGRVITGIVALAVILGAAYLIVKAKNKNKKPGAKSKKPESKEDVSDNPELKYSNIKEGQPAAKDTPEIDAARFLKKKK